MKRPVTPPAEPATPPVEPSVESPPAGTPRGHGRKALPKNLRRETIVVDISYPYDGSGRVAAVIDQLGRRSSLLWTGNSRTGLINSVGGRVTYAYDATGRLTARANPAGQNRRRTYDVSAPVPVSAENLLPNLLALDRP